MSYIQRKKSKNIKNIFSSIYTKALFSTNKSEKIAILWGVINISSLCMPWFIHSETGDSWWAFHSLNGNLWFFSLSIVIIWAAMVFGKHYKNKIFIHFWFGIKTYQIFFISWFSILLSSFLCVNFINWLSTFDKSIEYSNGIIIFIISGIFFILWWIFWKKIDIQQKHNTLFINESKETQKHNDIEKDNMKLPL